MQSNGGIYCLLLMVAKNRFEWRREGSAKEQSAAQMTYGYVGLQQHVSTTIYIVSKHVTQLRES